MAYEHKFKLKTARKWNKVGEVTNVIHNVTLTQLLKDDLGNVLREEDRSIDLLAADVTAISPEGFIPVPTAEATQAEKDAFATQLIQWGLDAMAAEQVVDYTAEFLDEHTDMLSSWKKSIVDAHEFPVRGPGFSGKQRVSKELEF